MAPTTASRPGRRPQRWREPLIEAVIRLAGFSAVFLVGLIFLFLLREGLAAFREVPPLDLLGRRWYPIEGHYGIAPLVLGSVLVTVVSVVITVPLGLVTAIYMAELAPAWLRDVLKPLIEVLAGIPSIVLGFLGWLILAPAIQAAGAPTGLTALTGALILAYMALPTIISIAEDALDAVPRSYRDAALAIGATRWQTTWRVVLPAARPGLVIAVMLGIGRAIGETMVVLMVTGNAANLPSGPDLLLAPVRTMTATIAAEMGEVARGSVHYHVLFAIGLVLFVITFLVNSLAARLVRRSGGASRRRANL
jgi:phosphate transport system permease protein